LLLALGIAVSVWLLLILVLVVAGKRTAAKELATLLPNLILLFKDLARDARVSRGSKWLLGLAGIWLVSPIDLIPEFIPVLGPLDDAVVAALVLRHIVKVAGREVVAEHWRGEESTLDRILRVAGYRREVD